MSNPLDGLIFGLRDAFDDKGKQLPTRSRIQFGAGLSAIDNPATGRIEIHAEGGGGGILYADDVAALRAAPLAGVANGTMAVRRDTIGIYIFVEGSTESDDGNNVVKPDTVGEREAGRWHNMTAGGGGGGGGEKDIVIQLAGGVYDASKLGFISAPLFNMNGGQYDRLHVHAVRRVPGSAGKTKMTVLVNGAPVGSVEIDSWGGQYAKRGVDIDCIVNYYDVIEVRLDEVEDPNPGPPEGPAGLTVLIVFGRRQP